MEDGAVGKTDLIPRDAAVRALVSSNGDYLDALERFEKIPAVDAMPVEWLRGLMLSTEDDVDKVEFTWIMREWESEQKEQEARW